MRYVRLEHIISTVCNEDVSDTESIASLLKKLSVENLDVSICVKQNEDSYGGGLSASYQNVRIVKVDKSTVDVCVYRSNGNLNLRNIPFDNILEMKVISKKTDLTSKKSSVSRIDYIDIEKDATSESKSC